MEGVVMQIRYLFSFILLFFLNANAQTLTMSTGFNHVEAEHIKVVVTEAFKRANIGLEYQILPNQRSLLNANSGISDGEAARIWKINKLYPNLVPVAPEVHAIDIVVLSYKNIRIKKLSDLSKYHVGVVRGVKITEILAANAKPIELIKTTSYQNLIGMLLNGRIDFVIVNKIGLYTDLKDIKNKTFYLKKKLLASVKVYMQLNKKHKALIPKFEKALKSMHEDGTYMRMHDSFMDSIHKPFSKSLKIITYD